MEYTYGTWKKSKHSVESNCVETTVYTKATASNPSGCCVEVGHCDQGIAVRDSKNPTGPVLHFTPDEWKAFISGVKDCEFDN